MDPKKGVFLTPQKGEVDPPSGGVPPKTRPGGSQAPRHRDFFGHPPHPDRGGPEKGGRTPPKRVKKWVIFERFLDPFSPNRERVSFI